MRIYINDNELYFSGNTVADLLAQKGFDDAAGLAIAVNETVITRKKWSSCSLKEGDSILIITPAQGG